MRNLLKKLSTKEKLGQLVQIAPFFYIRDLKDELYGPSVELGLSKDEIFMTGSVLGIGNPEEMIEVQKKYLETSKHKIPLVFMADIIHGYETIFPIPLALAGSFNEDMIKRVAEISATEAQTSGIHVTFSPMGDISREPRWGRIMESFGEDPHLNYVMNYQMVKGYQGTNIKNEGNLAACFKHFAGYGLSEAGRDYNTVDLSEYNLKQYFSQGYLGAINAGAKMAMTSFNLFEGIPATMNNKLINKILREDFRFDGLVISDYNGIRETIVHGISENEKEAAINSFNGGLDIEMVSATYMRELTKLFDDKILDMNELDKKVLKVLEFKKELGLFDNPYKGASRLKHDELVLSKEHLDFALKVSNESIILLKNDNILPLNKSQKVAVLGPNTNERDLNGAWSWHGSRNTNKTLHEAIEEHNLLTSLEQADVIIYYGGEHRGESGEAKSKQDINFNKDQLTEIIELKKYNKPIVLVNTSGRPNILTEVIKQTDALLQTWFLGTKGADAIYETLYGINNPSAKLPVTFPLNMGQIPIYYNHLPTGRPKTDNYNEYVSYYIDGSNKPLFPFGYGLSYTNFTYKDIKTNNLTIRNNKPATISVTIKNNTKVAGYEIVQLYIRDMFAKVSRPVKELKAFKKIWFEGLEEKVVSFEVNEEMLKYYDQKLIKRVDEGEFTVFVGTNSTETLELKISYIKGGNN